MQPSMIGTYSCRAIVYNVFFRTLLLGHCMALENGTGNYAIPLLADPTSSDRVPDVRAAAWLRCTELVCLPVS